MRGADYNEPLGIERVSISQAVQISGLKMRTLQISPPKVPFPVLPSRQAAGPSILPNCGNGRGKHRKTNCHAEKHLHS
jgi:hypothetical protein